MNPKNRFPKFVKILEKVTILAGVIGPLTVIPQIFAIFYTKNAVGVSAISWFAFCILDVPFITYGLIHRDKPITITYSLWFFANLTVACGAILYG